MACRSQPTREKELASNLDLESQEEAPSQTESGYKRQPAGKTKVHIPCQQAREIPPVTDRQPPGRQIPTQAAR
jgi:hypothetical protein